MTLVSRRSFLAAGAALALAPLRAGAAPTATLDGAAFGTTWRIAVSAARDPERLRGAVAALLAEIDAEMSPYRAESLISRVNRMTPGACAVTPEFARVAAAAFDLRTRSGCAFDPGVGPAVAHWGFGPIHDVTGPAGTITLDGERLAKTGAATLDFCGIAKGRALDRVADLLRARGETDFLVEIGGELLSGGRHPSGRQWQVAVEDPRPGTLGLAVPVLLDGAIATSGLKAQSYRMGARTYGHIIDPHAMAPVQAGALASVSVLAPQAMVADGWATALFAAGPVHGPDLARAEGVDALFLYAGPEGLRRVTTGAFRAAG